MTPQDHTSKTKTEQHGQIMSVCMAGRGCHHVRCWPTTFVLKLKCYSLEISFSFLVCFCIGSVKRCVCVSKWSLTFFNRYILWWSGVIGVAGTQRHILANERPQQAVYSSNKNLFCRPNQHKTSTIQPTHTAKHTQWTWAAKKTSKKCNQIVSLKNQISKICVSSTLFNYRFCYNYTTN